MKITNNLTPAQAIEAARKAAGQTPAVEPPAPTVGPAAQVDISAAAQSVAAAKSAADAAPEIRESLVAGLKSQVEAGTYYVSSSALADRIFQQAREYRLAA